MSIESPPDGVRLPAGGASEPHDRHPVAGPYGPTLDALDIVLGNIDREGRASRNKTRTGNFGPRGFGHTHDRTMIIEAEAAAVREAADRILEGETLSAVVHEWNRQGLRSTTGGPWRVNALSALLAQPRLAGLHVEHGRLEPRFPPIIDRETHERLVALRSSRSYRRRAPRRSLLTGLMRCGRCGGTLHYLYRSDSDQSYRCPSPAAGGCSGVIVKARFAEDFVRDCVVERLDSPEFALQAQEPLELVPDTSAELPAIVSEIHRDLDRLKELAALWGQRQISPIEWQQARIDVAKRMTVKEKRLRKEDSLTGALRIAGQGTALAERWPVMTDAQRKEIMSAVLDHVVVKPVGGTGGKFRRDRMCPVWRAL